MKSILIAVMATLLGFAAVIASPPAKADATPIDCGNTSCKVTKCDQSVCTVYLCENGVCSIVGSYPNPNPHPPKHQNIIANQGSLPASGECDISGNEPCAIKFCANGICTISLYEKKSKSFVPIGQVDDVSKQIDASNKVIDRMINEANATLNH